jgi:predicted RNA-binding protein with PUA-like domain
VDVTYKEDLVVPYALLKEHKEEIPDLLIFSQPRLSVSKVTEEEWDYIVSLGQ